MRMPRPKIGLAISTPLEALPRPAGRDAAGLPMSPIEFIIVRLLAAMAQESWPSVAVIGAAQMVLPGVRIAVFGMPADIHLGNHHATDIRPGGFEDAQGLKGLRNRCPAPGGDKDRLIGVGSKDPAVGDRQQWRSVD